MKKYLTAFIAVIVAVALSAFSLPKKSTNQSQTTYWWYQLNPQKTHTAGTPVNEEKLSEEDMIIEYGQCDDVSEPPCLAGFENPVTSPESISGLGDGEIITED